MKNYLIIIIAYCAGLATMLASPEIYSKLHHPQWVWVGLVLMFTSGSLQGWFNGNR